MRIYDYWSAIGSNTEEIYSSKSLAVDKFQMWIVLDSFLGVGINEYKVGVRWFVSYKNLIKQ